MSSNSSEVDTSEIDISGLTAPRTTPMASQDDVVEDHTIEDRTIRDVVAEAYTTGSVVGSVAENNLVLDSLAITTVTDSGAVNGTTEQTTMAAANNNNVPTVPTLSNNASTSIVQTRQFFRVTVGANTNQRTFNMDYQDFRNESWIFRENTAITGIVLGDSNPDHFSLILDWFNGYVGDTPITRADRLRYLSACRIARFLGLSECESQLICIMRRAESVLADMLSERLVSRTEWTTEEARERVTREIGRYLVRSPGRRANGSESESESESSFGGLLNLY